MNATSNISATAQSMPNEPPLFTFGTHAIQPTTRGWDRAPSSPRKSHRRGIKVWKRTTASRNTDERASAQLLGDLAASASGHAAKRQRVQHIPAVPTIKTQKLATYTSTITDKLAPPKRKMTKRRKSTKSPVKGEAQTSALSPRKSTSRRSSIRPVSRRQSEQGIPGLATNTLEPVSFAAYPDPEEIQPESSFLNTVNLAGSTMFDREGAVEAEDDSALTLDEETSAIEAGFSDEEEDDDSDADELEDEDAGQGLNSTARLLDAGNTGVVDVPAFGEDSDEEVEFEADGDEFAGMQAGVSTDDQSLELQDNVSGLLRTPSPEQPVADERLATPSPATQEETLRNPRSGPSPASSAATPPLPREETGSTVEFDEAFVRSAVIQVAKDHVFLSPVKAKDSPRSSLRSTPARETIMNAPILRVNQPSPQTPKQRKEADENLTEGETAAPSGAEHVEPGLSDEESIELYDAESADELFDGESVLQGMVFSPLKQRAGSPSRSPSPRKRSAPRLSDDTTYLNDFLSRVKAQAAARSSASIASPVKSTTPRRSPRKALEPLNANSPSPSPARRSSKENGSPIRLPKTPTAKLLTENMLSSPETPDELGEPARDDADGPRRSGRSRYQAPARLVMAAPNAIPLRRAEGEPFLLQRTETQKLAMATRANTRRNKGNAVMPRSMLEILESKELSPVKQREIGRNKKGQNVDWDNNLVYVLGEQKSRGKRKATVLAEEEGTVKEPSEPVAATPLPKKKAVRITKTARAAKAKEPAAEDKEMVKPVEDAVQSKPVEVEKKAHASRLRKPKATAVSLGTPAPAVKRAAVESTVSGIPAPRRRTRRD